MQSAQSAQASDLANAATDRPIANQAPASPPPSRSPVASSRSAAAQPTRFAEEAAAEAAPEAAPEAVAQPSRFAGEAALEAAISNGNISQNGGTIARGLSDTPWLSGEAERVTPAIEPERLSVTRQPERELVSQQSLSGASANSPSGLRVGQLAAEGTVAPIPISEGIRQVSMQSEHSFGIHVPCGCAHM